MNQYRAKWAAFRIDGYLFAVTSRHAVTLEAAFDEAKADAINALRRDIADIENMTISEYLAHHPKGANS